MYKIPPDILQLTLTYLDDDDLKSFCYANKYINSTVCNNDMWLNRIRDNFGLEKEIVDQYRDSNNYAAYYFNMSKTFQQGNVNDILIINTREGHLDLVIASLYRGADVNNNFDLAIQWACRYNNVEIVKVLLEAGANIHSDDDYALRMASYFGHLEIVKLLLESGSDVHAVSDCALHWAIDRNHTDIIELLQKYK